VKHVGYGVRFREADVEADAPCPFGAANVLVGSPVLLCQYQAADKRQLPIAYYSPQSGIGQTPQHLQASGPISVGAVGLGVGTLASCARAGDRFTFYELNADVERMASKHFTFLSDRRGEAKVVLGDARLSLEPAEPQGFNALVLDAFTGDAPPAHLLTEEAFAIYLRHLRPDGVLAFHITNRRVDLMPVVEGLADRFGFQIVRIFSPWNGDNLIFRSDWVMLTKNSTFMAAVANALPPAEDKKRDKVLWTDHYNNLFARLR
jgi:spermidine synthase